jgi:N-acetylglucosaminyldiphosphoundecaprenol N-acetyl-beta-D-mannosaminyltransferase
MSTLVEPFSINLPSNLGTVTPMAALDVVELISSRGSATSPLILANLNLHALYEAQVDAVFSSFCANADYVLIDGWPILKLAEFASKSKLGAEMRVGSTDWLIRLLEARPSISVVAIGGTSESSLGAAVYAATRSPETEWHAFNGFDMSRTSGDPAVSMDQALAEADLVLVGLGMPRQEAWINDNRHKIDRAVIANVGGCLDYLSGEQALAPRWLGGLGLEWLYRLAKNPRRLAGRYVVEPMKLAMVLSKRSRITSPITTR